MDPDTLIHKRELVAIHTRQLHEREKQAAKYGIDCPPYIKIEISVLKAQIEQLLREIGDTPDELPISETRTLPAPVLEESRQFAALTTFAVKKELIIHPAEQDIRSGLRVFSVYEQAACAKSVWEFDRIALYLYQEHTSTAALEQRVLHVQQEVERLQSRNHSGSLIPLHYAIRSMLTLLSARQGASVNAERHIEIFAETLDYIRSQPYMDKGGQVKRNLHKVLKLLGAS